MIVGLNCCRGTEEPTGPTQIIVAKITGTINRITINGNISKKEIIGNVNVIKITGSVIKKQKIGTIRKRNIGGKIE